MTKSKLNIKCIYFFQTICHEQSNGIEFDIQHASFNLNFKIWQMEKLMFQLKTSSL
jgi:hypothetical protein